MQFLGLSADLNPPQLRKFAIYFRVFFDLLNCSTNSDVFECVLFCLFFAGLVFFSDDPIFVVG